MKPAYSILAFTCSVALIGVASAQTVQEGEATQQPYPSTESQEIHPVPDTQQTPDSTPGTQQPQTDSPNTMQEQPIRPDTPQAAPGADTMDQTNALTQDEENFLENAIQGSYAEIEGSRLALEKSDNADVRQFAQMMIDDHQKMVEEASALASQKGITPPDGPSVMQTTEITALKALTGGAFDAMYVNRIGVAAHESTVEMFEEARQNVQDPDIRAMIDKTLPSLQEHLKMARTLNEQQENE